MEIRQLRYFVAVAETRHFGQAAEQLHMAQSPLSQAIRQLESQVGAPLFARTTRRVDLTPAGHALLGDALRILASLDEAQQRVRDISAGLQGVLTVGSTDLVAYRTLPRLARAVAQELPDVTLRFVPGLLTAAQEDALSAGRIDLGVLRPPLSRPGLAHRTISSEPLVLAVHSGHRLVRQDPVSLGALADEDFVLYGAPGSVVDAVVLQSCLDQGFLPRRAYEVSETPILMTHVAAGLGVALLPDSVRALSVDGVEYLSLAQPVSVEVALAWRETDRSPVLRRVLDVLAGAASTDRAELPTSSGASV